MRAAAVLAFASLIGLNASASASASAAAAAAAPASVYDATLAMCRERTSVGITNLERVIYVVTYLYRREAGESLFPAARVRIDAPEIVVRNLKAVALDLNLGQDQEVKALLRSPDFYRALETCFPDDHYANAAQLRAAFVVELIGLEATGKALGVGATFATGEAMGAALGALKLFSVRAHAWAVRSIIGLSVAAPVVKGLADVIERREVEAMLPRDRAARARGASAAEQSAALGEDLNSLARESGQALDLESERLNQVMDQLIVELQTRLAKEVDAEKRARLVEKIAVLRQAR